MPRTVIGSPILTACFLTFLAAVRLEAVPPSETLLPATTKGFIAVRDVDDLLEHWNGTQLGQLMADPVMEPFREDLRRQFEDKWTGIHEKLGLAVEDVEDVAGGEVAVAEVELAADESTTVLLADVTDHVDQAEAMLKKAATHQLNRGATRKAETVAGKSVTVFILPKDKNQEERRVVYLRQDDLLIAADGIRAVEGVLRRLAGQGPSLVELEAYSFVIDRCRRDSGDRVPQIRWFMEPFGSAAAVERAAEGRDFPGRRRRDTSMREVFKRTGFTAIRGIGGFVDVGVDGYELVHRTAVFAPPPYESSMRMMVLPNSSHFAPQPWVPRDVATYSSFHCDLLNGFDNFGPLFDEFFGEGETGVWGDVLDGLKNDEYGPQLDLRAELISPLANRVTLVSDYELPITPTCERLLFAIEAKDPAAVAAAVEKNLKDDKLVERRQVNGHVIWETIPQEDRPERAVRLDIPELGPGFGAQAGDGETEPLFPNASITVAHGHLLVASHYDFLIKILTPVEDREKLHQTIEWMMVDAALKDLGAKEDFVRTFSRTADEYRATYELVRQGKMPESETVTGRIANSFLDDPETDDLREPELDGSKLPDYDMVRRHLGPAGLFGRSEKSGWFFKGFALPNQGL